MLDFAYGELNLLPDVFWSLSWGEYYRMVRGYNRRAERDSYATANILAAIYNTIPRKAGKDGYTADDFMAKKTDTDRQDMTPEERQQRAKEALERSKRFDGKGVVKKVI